MAAESVEQASNGGGSGLYLTNALNNEEIECLLNKDSKSSQQAEKYAVLKFRHYLAKRGEPLSLENLCYHVTSGNMDAKERLLAYLTTFFGDLRKADGSKYKFNALRSVRYALNRFTLKFGVDFLNDTFLKKPLNDAWVALGERLKKEGMADVQHHDVLSLEEVKKAYAWCNQNLSDPDRLQKRIFMDIYLYFGRQCRQNLPHLTKDNFGMDIDSNNIRFVYFIEQDSSGTTSDALRRGNDQVTMRERPGDANCPVSTFLKYVSKLDPHYPRFFCHQKLNIDPAYHTVWYTKQPMGEKKMAEIMKSISTDASLNKIYTNHCLRSTLLYLMDEGGLDAKDVSRLTSSNISHSSTKLVSPPAVSLASPHTAVTWPPQSNHQRNKLLQDVNTSQSFLNPSTSSPSINSYNLNTQNSGIDTKPLTVNQADLKKQQLEFLEAQMLQADVEAKKRQAEVQKRQAELAEAKKLAEKLAEEERLRKESENKIYKYMVLNHEKKILETLRALWKGNQFCDATLQNECISIPVHKILLIACCPKILETYDYIMKDTNVQVCFPRKVTAEALKAFVDYLYNGSLNLSKSILDSMEYLSGMLGLDDIRQLCNQFRSDMLNDTICLPDKTIVNVTNSHDQSSHQMSYNDPILPPPPIVRPSTHSTANPTAVSIQLSSNFQDVSVSSAQSNDFSLFPEPHSNSVLTEVSHIKLEPEVDLTAEDCTEIKQESIHSDLYGADTNCKFTEWSTATLEPHSSSQTFIHRKKSDLNNFELSTTVDLSLAPLNSFQKQTAKNISSGVSPRVITISPSNSPCQSPRLTESPSHIQTLQISNTHTIPTSNTNPFPVSLISANGQSISLTDQDNKRKHFGDYDCKDDRKRPKIILN